MKKITLIFLLFIFGYTNSQVVVENFDGATTPTVNGFEGLGSASVTADTSPGMALGNVLEIVSSSSGQGWQGAELIFQTNFIDLTITNTVEVDVYSTTSFTLFAKVEDKVNNSAPASAADETHGGTGWETLIFTFNENLDGTTSATGEYSQIAFFPNWNGGGWNTPPADFTILVDEVSAVLGSAFPVNLDIMENFDGTAPTVNGFEGLGSASVIADTSPGMALGNVMEIVSSSSGQGWQGAELVLQSDFIDLTSSLTIEVDVYSTTPFTMLLKAEDKVNNTAPAAASDESHTGSGWETLTYTMNESLDGTMVANGEYSHLAFFPNWNGGGWNTPPADFTILVDEVRSTKGSMIGGIPQPSGPAPVPTIGDASTYSVYNDTNSYTNSFPVVYTFGGGLLSEVDLDPSATTNNAYQFNFSVGGFGQGEGGPDDVTPYGFVSFDYWADTGVPGFRFVMISNNTNPVTEVVYEVGTDNTVVNGAWTKVVIPMSHFTTGGFATTNFFQWKVDPFMQSVAQGGFVYVDNILLTTTNPLSNDENTLATFKVSENPTNTSWDITSNANISNVDVFDILGKQVSSIQPNSFEVSIEASSLKSGIYFARIESENGSKTLKLVRR